MNRLFVALNSEPWNWFRDGVKTYELRRAKGAFALRKMEVGRDVELRRGYSKGNSLWGKLSRWTCADDLGEVMTAVGFKSVIPHAETMQDAIDKSLAILGDAPGPFIAFEVTGLTADSGMPPGSQNANSSERGTANSERTDRENELREMMRSPRYWRDHDPEYVEQVRDGFRRLYPE